MRWDETPEDRGRVRFAAPAGSVEGYGGRGVNGHALHPAGHYLFPDHDGGDWWVIFQARPSARLRGHRVAGDILACSDSPGDMVHVMVLAANVWEDDAEAAFRADVPSRLEDAARVAAGVPRAVGAGGGAAEPAVAPASQLSRRGPRGAG
ncbi:hypothetical protein QF031_000662 [Pseudarthrobacter defluvii]|uniref:hypothetical protein n=1 Tax=Pseudarthrobacter defluvii TaxID=410837 RepID=UPI0027883988|nr:hypothetical protein [Pseudarthrobacter defluvii]MDQ0767913.1 hypothetical protein [Pseudarthrobacter defluvii]